MSTMRDGRRSGSWFGFALIAVGVLFLVQNYLGYELHNWWALFVLIPAVGFFSSAWYSWRSGHGAYAAAGSLTMGLVFTAVSIILLLDLPWGRVWPIFLILAGVGLLLPALVGRRART
jgi:hypothetical protein